MSGPPRKSIEQKILEGNFRKDRMPENLPRTDYRAPKPPKYLSKEAIKVWDSLVPVLSKMGVLADSDQLALSALCDATATWQECIKYFKTHDNIYKSGTTTRIHPMLKIKQDAWKNMLQLMDRFGLSPSCRSKIEATSLKSDTDEFDDFLNSLEPN